MVDEESEMILPVTDGPAAYPVVDSKGSPIGYVHLPPLGFSVSPHDIENLRHDVSQLRTQLARLQSQLKLLENRICHR